MDRKPRPEKLETRPTALREAMVRRLTRQVSSSGRIAFKCVPSMVDTYLDICVATFLGIRRVLSADDTSALRAALSKRLGEGFTTSPHSWVLVDYETELPPSDALRYVVRTKVVTMQEEYKDWIEATPPPLFGAHPDAKVVDVASSLGEPGSVPVLDAGAGDGRNALPLARRGHAVTALEMAPVLVEQLRKDVEAEQLAIRVLEGDVTDPATPLLLGSCKLVVLAGVVSHFRNESQARAMFQRASEVLMPGGMLLLNAFLCHESYTPDRLAREMAQAYGSAIFTRKEIATARDGLPFELLTDESTLEYEKERRPPERWPPTPWFVNWAQGRDIFRLDAGIPPVELRWLTFRRQ